ncbi:MAG: hypothetical protein D8H91_13845 [Alloprevotella sp.]|nr:MAG: hypothetical protein D8H91_13845 [Alloprevotella sp.]
MGKVREKNERNERKDRLFFINKQEKRSADVTFRHIILFSEENDYTIMKKVAQDLVICQKE